MQPAPGTGAVGLDAIGAVVLVAGHGAFAQPTRLSATLTTLGRIGEVFVRGGAGWRIQRLAPGEGEGPSRIALRRALDAAVEVPGPCVIVLVGAVVGTALGPAFVCAAELGDYAEDATLPLAWLGDRLRRHRGEPRACVLIADGGERDRQRWLTALADTSSLLVVASEAADALDAVLDGLWGDAVDDTTGTVTARALGDHLSRRLPMAAIRDSPSVAALVWSRPMTSSLDPRIDRLIASGGGGPPPLSDLVGTVLPGRFRITAELGRGAAGVVYRAHQDLLGRDVAIKVLTLGDAATRDDAELFLQEIRSAARLDHRNLVRIHFADIFGRRRMFFAMELLAGRDLQRILDEDGPIGPVRALALVTQLLAGLEAAHQAGLVHADVKPANLIVVADGDRERLVLVDFGLSRLRGREPTPAIGGTAAFMAPEQRSGFVDPRADLYAAARVMITMLTGRPEVADPVAVVDDPAVGAALARALADDPGVRFPSAAAMSSALHGTVASPERPPPRPPFRHAAPFVEQDRDDFHGREREIAALLDAVLYRRCVIYTAPSGAGKTSLLRAGLLPRLAELEIDAAYLACRPGTNLALAGAVSSAATALGEAIADRRASGGRLVLLLDQLEVVFGGDPDATAGLFAQIHEVVTAPDVDIAVVLSVREEILARVLEHAERLAPGPPLRLRPLTVEQARHAVALTLRARRLTIPGQLLDALMDDLAEAARRMGAQLGWGDVAAVYPPHLQLVGAVLDEARPAGVNTFTLASYLQLGRLAGIHGEHLHRVLEGELTPARTEIARDLLLALMSTSHTRDSLDRGELVARVAAGGRPAEVVDEVVGFLCDRGLVVTLRGGADAAPVCELAHDSLVPRIAAWVTSTDLARRRALELVRHHLRRSERGALSLLDVDELREVDRCTGVADLAELDVEWAGRAGPGGGPAGSASEMIALSRRAVRARRLAITSTLAIAGVVVGLLAVRWLSERAERRHAATLRDRDIGTFAIIESAFDWDPSGQVAVPVPLAELPELTWRLHKVDPTDPDSPGDPYPASDVVKRVRTPIDADTARTELAARGGAAVIVIHGRGRRLPDGSVESCADSIVPVRRLPGFSSPGATPVYRLTIPTCAASRVGTVELTAGPTIVAGVGEPASSYGSALPPERTVALAAFAIDRTEVTNGAFAVFASMAELHSIPAPDYPASNELKAAGAPDYPVSFVNWPEARAYCRYLGKDLPTLDQWDRALRGAATIAGADNPAPRRTFAWPGPFVAGAAAVPDGPGRRRPYPVESFPHDRSPDGVFDLSGNLQEWLLASPPDDPTAVVSSDETERAAVWAPAGRFRISRGCNWSDTECSGGQSAVDFAALPNQRPFDLRNFMLGFRCSLPGAAGERAAPAPLRASRR